MSFAWYERRQKCREFESLPLEIEIEIAKERAAFRREMTFALVGLAFCAVAWFFISPWVDSFFV